MQRFHHGRIALFFCAITPLLVWPLSGQALAHPWQIFCWSMLFALAVACVPRKMLWLSALLSTLLLPLTLGWMGTVVVSGYGPSNAAFEAANAGAFQELWVASQLAFSSIVFWIGSVLHVTALLWAWYAIVVKNHQADRELQGLLLVALLPLLATNLDAAGFPSINRIVGPEARLSVPWLSHQEWLKARLSAMLDSAARGTDSAEKIRDARQAPKLFTMSAGLAVFVVGESLRADALMQAGRGPWSAALQARITQGLGMRLSDACAGANSTFGSVPRLLTVSGPDQVLEAASKPGLLAYAKAAGAKTAYIINHETWVFPETGHDFLQRTSSMQVHVYDESVIEALSDFAQRSGKGPKAALLHLYGQHFFYRDRYPASAFPTPDGKLAADELDELHYARAAEYGLKVLLDLATTLDQQQEPAFMLFTSDHGENLASDRTGKKFHALPVSGQNDTIVPVLALWNRAFAQSDKVAQLALLNQHTGRWIAHQDVVRAWLHLIGLPGTLHASENPHPWGSLNATISAASIACATLQP